VNLVHFSIAFPNLVGASHCKTTRTDGPHCAPHRCMLCWLSLLTAPLCQICLQQQTLLCFSLSLSLG